MARWVGFTPAAPSRMNCQSLTQNIRNAPVGQPVGAIIVFRILVHRLEEGAEHEGRAIDEDQAIAFPDGGAFCRTWNLGFPV